MLLLGPARARELAPVSALTALTFTVTVPLVVTKPPLTAPVAPKFRMAVREAVTVPLLTVPVPRMLSVLPVTVTVGLIRLPVTVSVPLLTVVLPLYVLAPARIQRPVPDSTRDNLPAPLLMA